MAPAEGGTLIWRQLLLIPKGIRRAVQALKSLQVFDSENLRFDELDEMLMR